MAGVDKWSKEEIDKAQKEVDKGEGHWTTEFDGEFPEEEVQYDSKGEIVVGKSGKFPKEVHFVDGEKLEPHYLGRVVHAKIHEVEVEETNGKVKVTVKVLNELMEELNKEARKYGCEYKLLTRAGLKEVKEGMSTEEKKTAVAEGMRTLSTDFPMLHSSMKTVVKEIEECEEEKTEWKKENLTKTAKVLKEIEERHNTEMATKKTKDEGEGKKGPAGKKARGPKHMQGWLPFYCAVCYSAGKDNTRLAEVGQVCVWRTEERVNAKVKMMCCRIRIHSCSPQTGKFMELFKIAKKAGTTEEAEAQPLQAAKERYPSEAIIGSTFDELKGNLDKWSPEKRVAPPGMWVELNLGKEAMQSDKETRRYVHAVNTMEWLGLKVREVRDTQWKHFFYMGNVLQRAPEFMKGGEEYKIPRATSKWGAHVYMDAAQIMMGCQKLMEEGETGILKLR